MLSRLVITFLPRSKRLIISWLQSPSIVILEPRKIKSDTVSTVSPSISHEVVGLVINLSKCKWGFPGRSMVKNPPVMQETQVGFLSQEDPLEKEIATHSSILAWEVQRSLVGNSPWSRRRVGHNLATKQQQQYVNAFLWDMFFAVCHSPQNSLLS